MRKIDCHMHTYSLVDSETDPKVHIHTAIAKRLNEICFIDHRDFHYPECPFELDADNYFKKLKQLQRQFQQFIKIKIGLEISSDVEYIDEINRFADAHDYDYVIGSIHVIHQIEFYEPAAFFINKIKEEARREFFLNILEYVQTFDCFNCLGHLDYICRYGPYVNKEVKHSLHQDIIDDTFKTLIHKGKGLEVNTSGYKTREVCGFPNFEQIQRYYDLGGRVITIGSDSYTSDRAGGHIEDVIKEYQHIGSQNVSILTKRARD